MNKLLARRPFTSRFFDDDTFGMPNELFNGGSEWFPSRMFKRSLLSDLSMPAVNIKDNDDVYELEFAVPGYRKEDLKVNVKDGVITISSEKKVEKDEKEENYTRREFSYSSFERSFLLPENVDPEKVKAKVTDGVLNLSIGKTKAKPAIKGREIKIS